MKSKLLMGYLGFGVFVCIWFGYAAAHAWRAPDFGIVNYMGSGSSSGGYGRSYGGSWGGGK
jgi:hypothetical protein